MLNPSSRQTWHIKSINPQYPCHRFSQNINCPHIWKNYSAGLSVLLRKIYVLNEQTIRSLVSFSTMHDYSLASFYCQLYIISFFFTQFFPLTLLAKMSLLYGFYTSFIDIFPYFCLAFSLSLYEKYCPMNRWNWNDKQIFQSLNNLCNPIHNFTFLFLFLFFAIILCFI